tara:strand:+ start:2487 stop:2825 length:339 start_codon:yes stop_codon:yes gene_type:complete
MISYNLDNIIDVCELEKVLKAGNNITITKLDDCTLEISSSGGGGNSNGIKYHLKNGDNITVQDCFEYFIACNFIVDNGATMTIENGARLIIHSGIIINEGLITNNGLIKIGL